VLSCLCGPSVQELFSAFGPVSRIYVAYDRVTGQHRGFAFVNFLYRRHLQLSRVSCPPAQLQSCQQQHSCLQVIRLPLPSISEALHHHPVLARCFSSPPEHPGCMDPADADHGWCWPNRDDANRAIEKLDGYGYDNLILRVEYAAPREDRPPEARGGGR